MSSHLLRAGALAAGCGCSAVWARSVVLSVRPGLWRFLLCAPILAFYVAAPFLYDARLEVVARTMCVFHLTWLAAFKVLSLCIHRGPLLGSWTLPQFLLLLNAPVIPQQQDHPAQKKAGRLQDSQDDSTAVLGRYLAKIGLLGAVVYLLTALEPPTLARHLLYAFGMYSLVGLVMDGVSAAALTFLDLRLTPTFDSPWLSASLREFWGRRWNIPTASLLRFLIYDPITEGRLIGGHLKPAARPSMALRLAATTAVFFVSGAAHEMILWYADSFPAGYRWLAFFTIQGPLCALEAQLAALTARRGIKVPWVVRWVLALGLLEQLACYWFFYPVEESGLAARVVASVLQSYVDALGSISRLVR